MRIEVLGDQCGKCRLMHQHVLQAVAKLEIAAEIVHTNVPEVLAHYGVRGFPGLAIDGKLKSAGKVLTVAEVRGILAQASRPDTSS
ncbi:MAG: thioredoxin family protein [Desulfuromonadales bacterium]